MFGVLRSLQGFEVSKALSSGGLYGISECLITETLRRTLRRPSTGDDGIELMDESDARLSASCLGPSGMSGTVLSPKTLWLWEEYFWWNGEGIVYL